MTIHGKTTVRLFISYKKLFDMTFNKPKQKPLCEHFYHVVQRLKSLEEPNRSFIDEHIKCNHFDKRITKRTCIDCKEYKPIK